MIVPQSPGLGVELDDSKLVQYELTPQRHREYDQLWTEIQNEYGVPMAESDLLVRHF